MTVKDSHSTSFCGTFKSQKLVKTVSPYVLILVFIYHGKTFNSIVFKSSVLVQMVFKIF